MLFVQLDVKSGLRLAAPRYSRLKIVIIDNEG